MQKRTARPRGKCDGPKQLAIYAAAANNIQPAQVMERRACKQLVDTIWKRNGRPLEFHFQHCDGSKLPTRPTVGKQNSTSTLQAAGQVTFPPNCVWECFCPTGKDLSHSKLYLHSDMTFGRHRQKQTTGPRNCTNGVAVRFFFWSPKRDGVRGCPIYIHGSLSNCVGVSLEKSVYPEPCSILYAVTQEV